MGSATSMLQTADCLCNFETVQTAIAHPSTHILINTLPLSEQHCLIKSTLSCLTEEQHINQLIADRLEGEYTIILYGKHNHDPAIWTKKQQLTSLGFPSVSIYLGGLFEWLLLQDIYGKELFPTLGVERDLLRFKP